MPELPDVGCYQRHLQATAMHRAIRAVEVANERILRGITARKLRARLVGRQMILTHRHGKHLLVRLDQGGWLTFHFGMTGRPLTFEDPADDPEHDRLRLDFEDGGHLAYDNQRLLGGVGLVEDPKAYLADLQLGLDALDPALDKAAFRTLLAGKRGQLKSALMDQSLLAGIGNIYSDEILFQARLHPKRMVASLEEEEIDTLYDKLRSVLQTAIEANVGYKEPKDRLPAGFLLPHRQKGSPCPRCGTEIATIKVSGRTAYYCPRCQPAPSG